MSKKSVCFVPSETFGKSQGQNLTIEKGLKEALRVKVERKTKNNDKLTKKQIWYGTNEIALTITSYRSKKNLDDEDMFGSNLQCDY